MLLCMHLLMVCPWFSWIALPVVPFTWISVLMPSTLTFNVPANVAMCGCTALAGLVILYQC